MNYTWLNENATTYADLPAVSISSETYQSAAAITYGYGNIFSWEGVDDCSNDICVNGFSTSRFAIGRLYYNSTDNNDTYYEIFNEISTLDLADNTVAYA